MGGAGLAGTIKTQQNHGGMDMSTINSVTAAAYTTTAYESKAAAKKRIQRQRQKNPMAKM